VPHWACIYLCKREEEIRNNIIKHKTMHHATIVGRLGQDAIVKEINGKQFVSMSVCRDEIVGKSPSGESVKEPTWYNVTIPGNGGAKLQYLLTGVTVTVVGRERANAFLDNKSGKLKVGFNIYAFEVYLSGGSQRYEQDAQPQQSHQAYGDREEQIFPPREQIDDLPM
jgi:single-strand DNA-binding protein